MRLQLFMGCVAAFLFASLTFVVTFAIGTFLLMYLSLSVVLAHALMLGLPIFLILWWKRWVNPVTCICAGFIVAVASGVFRHWPLTVPMGSSVWAEFGPILIFLGVLGALAGLIFWTVLSMSGALSPVGSQTDPSERARHGAAGAGYAIALAVVAVLITAAGYVLTSINLERFIRISHDTTCHNLLRDRQSISPQVSIVSMVPTEDLPKLTQLVEEFARTRALSFRNSSAGAALYLSICNDGLAITLSNLVEISVFELQPGSSWQRMTKELIDTLQTQWPGKILFRAPSGGYMPRPAELQ